ncbi:MAG: type II secretion system protein [Methylotenera sp.]|nr:type II secretion system protein [Oligoflexia bacterium]
MPSLLRSNSGFTLLETMIAMTIMLMAFASILMVESSSVRTSAKAKQMNVVAMLARNEMVKFENDFEGKPFAEVKKDETGQFKPPFQDYTWVHTVREMKFPAMNMSGGGGTAKSGTSGDKVDTGGTDQIAELLTKLITQYFSDAIREATVTIKWKRGASEQSFSVSTYWVDLNHEFKFTE